MSECGRNLAEAGLGLAGVSLAAPQVRRFIRGLPLFRLAALVPRLPGVAALPRPRSVTGPARLGTRGTRMFRGRGPGTSSTAREYAPVEPGAWPHRHLEQESGRTRSHDDVPGLGVLSRDGFQKLATLSKRSRARCGRRPALRASTTTPRCSQSTRGHPQACNPSACRPSTDLG